MSPGEMLGFGICCVSPLLIAGAGLVVHAAKERREEAWRRATWESAAGRVESTGIVVSRFGLGRVTRQGYITLTYEVAGVAYRRDELVGSAGAADVASGSVAAYPAGAAVEVWFDPARPGEGHLEHNAFTGGGCWSLFGWPLVLAGVAGVVAGLRGEGGLSPAGWAAAACLGGWWLRLRPDRVPSPPAGHGEGAGGP